MIKTILFAVAVLLTFINIASAQVVFDGGPDGTGIDFFVEANWVDMATGLDPADNTIGPNGTDGTIGFDLTIGGDFDVEGATANGNIRLDSGLTLTLEGNATLFSQVFSAPTGAEINIVLADNSELTVTQNIARTAFDLSGSADLIFTGSEPEFTNDSINLSSDWTGSITTTNSNRMLLQGASGQALFNVATIDGVVASSDDIVTEQVGGSIVHTLADTNSVLVGDVNRDGVVDFLDISPFITFLSFGADFRDEADIDRNGIVDFLDISPFITLLSGQ